jgi:hypothetical protein
MDGQSKTGRTVMSATPKLSGVSEDETGGGNGSGGVKLPAFEEKSDSNNNNNNSSSSGVAAGLHTLNMEWGAHTSSALSGRLNPASHASGGQSQMPLLASARQQQYQGQPYTQSGALVGDVRPWAPAPVLDRNGTTYHTEDGEFLLSLGTPGSSSNNNSHSQNQSDRPSTGGGFGTAAYSDNNDVVPTSSGAHRTSMDARVTTTNQSDARSSIPSHVAGHGHMLLNYDPYNNATAIDPRDMAKHAAVTGALAEGMSLSELNQYLSVHGFLHVTPRFNVESVQHHNWYDLVILEVPGNCKTGIVWRKKFSSRGQHGADAADTFQLERHQVVQLSLDGALIYGEPTDNPDDRDSELLPLADLVQEKAMAEAVRKLRFFKYYREYRSFLLLKNFTRRSRMERVKMRLSTHSVFSHIPLVHAMQHIRGLTLDLEESTELFAFNGHGSQHVSAYLDLQIKRVKECKEEIAKAIDGISTFITNEHERLTCDEFLKDDINDVRKHHPYLLAEELGMPVAWSEVRSVKVVRSRMHAKIEGLCYVAQFMVEYAMARVLERFWVRATLFTRGIYRVPLGRHGNSLSPAYHKHYSSSAVSASAGTARDVVGKVGKQGSWTIKEGKSSQPWKAKGKLSGRVAEEGEEGYDDEDEEEEDEEEDKPASQLAHENTIAYTVAKPSLMSGNNVIINTAVESAATTAIRAFLTVQNDATDCAEIDDDWESGGSHAHLDVVLCLDNSVASSSAFITTNNFNRLHVRVVPGKYNFLDHMHALCGEIGHLLERLPNLRTLPLITSENMVLEDDPTALAMVDVEDGATAHSINYFSYLHMHHIVACTKGLQWALDWLQEGQVAHAEAVKCDTQILRLQETFRKLHLIHPDSLAQQLCRSLVLNKVKEIIVNPETADDVGRAVERDKGRLGALAAAVQVMESAREVAGMYPNLKHSRGFISNFKRAGEQVLDVCAIKESGLFSRLPSVFYMRATQLTSKMNGLVNEFELDGADLSAQISLLRKLKNFELARDAFDVEVEVCESLYHQVKRYNASPSKQLNLTRIKNLEEGGSTLPSTGGRTTKSRKASLNTNLKNTMRDNDVDACFHAYESSRARLFAAIGASRSLLIGMLAHMRSGALDRRRVLHTQVATEMVALQKIERDYQEMRRQREAKARAEWIDEQKSFGRVIETNPMDPLLLVAVYYTDPDNNGETIADPGLIDMTVHQKNVVTFNSTAGQITASDVSWRIQEQEECGERIYQLKCDIEAILQTQTALLDAHDIIGAAAPVLLPTEMDHFTDMAQLETVFTCKKTAWDSIRTAITMKRHITTSKLSALNAHHLQRKLDRLQRVLADLEESKLALDEQATLSALQGHIATLVPKLEIGSYLTSTCLRPRHWRWLSDKVLNECGLTLRFAGLSGEQITAVDTRGKDHIGMGYVSRMEMSDLLYRGVDGHLDKIRRLTSDAAIEGMIEQTMDQ